MKWCYLRGENDDAAQHATALLTELLSLVLFGTLALLRAGLRSDLEPRELGSNSERAIGRSRKTVLKLKLVRAQEDGVKMT